MKNRFSISILLVCLLALSFVFVGCGEKDALYTGGFFTENVSQFNSNWSTTVTETTPLTFFSIGSLIDYNNKSVSSPNPSFHDVPIDYIEQYFNTYFTQSERNQYYDRLKSDGYVIAYKGKGSGTNQIQGFQARKVN